MCWSGEEGIKGTKGISKNHKMFKVITINPKGENVEQVYSWFTDLVHKVFPTVDFSKGEGYIAFQWGDLQSETEKTATEAILHLMINEGLVEEDTITKGLETIKRNIRKYFIIKEE